MILNVLLMFSLFFAIYRVISHIFKFEKLTQLTSSVMPVYSLNMFFTATNWNLKNVTILSGLILISTAIV